MVMLLTGEGLHHSRTEIMHSVNSVHIYRSENAKWEKEELEFMEISTWCYRTTVLSIPFEIVHLRKER